MKTNWTIADSEEEKNNFIKAKSTSILLNLSNETTQARLLLWQDHERMCAMIWSCQESSEDEWSTRTSRKRKDQLDCELS